MGGMEKKMLEVWVSLYVGGHSPKSFFMCFIGE
jgi:hypothetical protein